MSEGMKYDSDKLKYHLFPPESLEEVVKVLTHGARKYDDENWRKVDNKHTRYYSALMRHIEAWRLGEMNDPETDCHHLAHAMCCLIFLMQEELEMEAPVPDVHHGVVAKNIMDLRLQQMTDMCAEKRKEDPK